MKVMVLVKATKDSEAGVLPSTELLTAMGKFNEELVKAGVMLAAEGLKPSSKGARVRFSGKTRTMIEGPFAETNELVAGFWIWQVGSMQEAIDWVKRCPNPMPGDSEIEIRPVYSIEDFGDNATPEAREMEQRLRRKSEALSAAKIAPARFQQDHQRLIGGASGKFTMQTAAQDIPPLWQRFMPHFGKMPGQKGMTTYGVSWGQTPSGEFNYLCGVEVAETAALPEGLSTVRLPEGQYAVFEHSGHVSGIGQLIGAIHQQWLPASGFEQSAPLLFERYTKKFDPETHSGGIEIWIPVRKKS